MSEQIYDEIAPQLAAIAKLCKMAGMSFIACVQYDDEGSIGKTVSLVPGSCLMMRCLDTLESTWQQGGIPNIDGFMIALAKHVRETGMHHSSMVLRQMGVPTEPKEPKEPQP